ncbi:hypothetical protein ACUODJ_16010, partial [Escherichia sp. HC-CC]
MLQVGNFQFFSEMDDGGGPITEVSSSLDTDITEPTEQLTKQLTESSSAENPEGEPPEDVEQSQAFVKRLQERTQAAIMEERSRWEQEISERYGNYDTYDRAMNFFMKQAGYNDVDSMMQAIEQQDLLQRAEFQASRQTFQH